MVDHLVRGSMKNTAIIARHEILQTFIFLNSHVFTDTNSLPLISSAASSLHREQTKIL